MNDFRRFALLATFLFGSTLSAEEVYRVEVKDSQTAAGEIQLPLDSTVRIKIGHSNNIHFGLTVDGFRISCSPEGSIWPAALIDGRVINPANIGVAGKSVLLPAGPNGRTRYGLSYHWRVNDLDFTQVIEVVPGKPPSKEAGARRRLDTCRITYLVENKGNAAHEVAFRSNVDILINQNDGALFASPATAPGKILNGVVLAEKTLPPYLHVLERPDVNNPGMMATMTLRFGSREEGPSKVVLTQLGALGVGWDVPALMAGDSACALFWESRTLGPGQKREMVWAYGGGIATSPESEGKVSVTLAGSLEPGKLFSLAALVEDPVVGQSLRLELPPGVERVEGAELQPVPAATSTGNSLVLWKGRVLRPGLYDLRVHSSTGTVRTKSVSIVPVGGS